MRTPIRIKIRVAIVLALALSIFYLIGWPAVRPLHPAQPLTILFHHAPSLMLLKMLGLIVLTTALALLVAGSQRHYIAPVAVPVGLCVWAIASPGLTRVLIDNADLPARKTMYYLFAGEACIWFFAILLAWLLVKAATARATHPSHPPAHRITPHKKAGPLARLTGNSPAVQTLLAFVLCSALAILLLKLFARAGTAWQGQYQPVPAAVAPLVGQATFAIAAAWALAVFATHQLFIVKPFCFLLSPPFLAILIYYGAARQIAALPLGDIAPAFIPAASVYAAMSPLQYIAIGSFAALAGYWLSIRAHRLRRHTAEQA